MNHAALDYRENYPHNPQRLTTGQMLMNGAGAVALGGIGFAIFAKVKESRAKENATAAAA